MSVGPNGTAQYRITTDDGFDEVSCQDGFLIADTLIDDLGCLGLPRMFPVHHRGACASAAVDRTAGYRAGGQALEPLSPNSPAKTVRNAQDLTGAEIDAANAEIEQRLDDARIKKLVVDVGPGGTAKMHGVRQGLTGTYRQRVRHDQVTFRVETMNPNATVVIDPAECATGIDGHVIDVLDGEDTVVTITATSPDGTSQSEIKYIAVRTAEDGQESA